MLLGDRGGDSGESKMLGTLYFSVKKAMVQIIAAIALGAKVPFQHKNWGAERLTLGDVQDK